MTLREWMDREGMTVQRLAALVGEPVAEVRGWESGRTKPTPYQRELVAQVTKGEVGRGDWA